ncbi:hypothetical protein [Flectobacillus major]|uniref:hypothetical protein n=1 Tax=Flectobacillus major TaxID=103 RepID=UPI00040D2DC4|nr:hypothetical protein [Flectobacillus major]
MQQPIQAQPIQEIELLLVEDSETQLKNYHDAIDNFHETDLGQLYQFRTEIAKNLSEALDKLAKKDFDFAFVDLKLESSSEQLEGNTITTLILDKFRFPVFIISGHIGDIDPELQENMNIFFQAREKGSVDIYQLLKETIDIYKTGVTKILKRNGKVEEYLNRIFREHLIHSMDYWISLTKENKINPYDAVLRHILAHMQEYLEVSENGFFENYHAPEFYIVKPIKQSDLTVFTGDVIMDTTEKKYYLIITPTCDLATGVDREGKPRIPKAKYITLLEINTKSTIDFDAKGNKRVSTHYLPPLKDIFEGGLVEFQLLKSETLENVLDTKKYNIKFSISSAFKKDIVARFSNYYSRQGQPALIG